MIRSSPFLYGVNAGTHVCFDRRGEGLPLHSHAPDGEHAVILLRGAIAVNGEVRFDAPAVLTHLTLPHEIAALEDGTEILQLFRQGKPLGWEDERAGAEDARPLKYPIDGL